MQTFLLDHYDEACPITDFHREWWRMVCSDHPRVVIAAPRSHAKSTAINHAYGLAAALFRQHPFQLKISRTYKLAVEKLQQAREELETNRKIRSVFGIRSFDRDQEDDLIVSCDDGYRFRMQAVSAEQDGIRGTTWGTMRPALVLGDDLEGDEQVLSDERRRKMLTWWLNTIMPIGNLATRFRVIGTVMHNDSLLVKLLNSKAWKGKTYEGCDEMLGNILWPEKYNLQWWQDKKAEFAGFGNVSGFNREYRNIATDTASGFFRPEDFRPMREEDHDRRKTFYVGGDLAFSKKEHRDYSVFTVGGIDEEGVLHVVDERRGRWDGNEVIDEMYAIEEAWHPAEWFIESGAIKETLGAALEIRMPNEGYLNIAPDLIPTKDKAVRAMPMQARMRAKGVRFDTQASWFGDFQQELLQFAQQGTRAPHDDRVDALAWLGQGLKRMSVPQSVNDDDFEDWLFNKKQVATGTDGRNPWTGY